MVRRQLPNSKKQELSENANSIKKQNAVVTPDFQHATFLRRPLCICAAAGYDITC